MVRTSNGEPAQQSREEEEAEGTNLERSCSLGNLSNTSSRSFFDLLGVEPPFIFGTVLSSWYLLVVAWPGIDFILFHGRLPGYSAVVNRGTLFFCFRSCWRLETTWVSAISLIAFEKRT